VMESSFKRVNVQFVNQQKKLKDIMMTIQNHLRCVGYVSLAIKNGIGITNPFMNRITK